MGGCFQKVKSRNTFHKKRVLSSNFLTAIRNFVSFDPINKLLIKNYLKKKRFLPVRILNYFGGDADKNKKRVDQCPT